jgi:hypothetical protein
MDSLPQWPRTAALRKQYAEHLREEFDQLSPGQLVVMLSEGLTAIDRNGFVEFKGTPLIASHDPYAPPARLYACQLVDLSVSIMQDPADPLDAVLQAYNASCDPQLDGNKRFFWSDVFRRAADYMAAPQCIEIARAVLHDPTRLFVERARIIMLRFWTAAVVDHAVGIVANAPWITPQKSSFHCMVEAAMASFKATPATVEEDDELLRRRIDTEAKAADYAADADADLIVYVAEKELPVRPTLRMLAKRDKIVLALKLLFDTSVGKPIVAVVQDEKRLPEGTPGCFAACCCYLHDHARNTLLG